MDATALLVIHLKAKNLPRPVFEYRFHRTRKWRFDLAWPSAAPGPQDGRCPGGEGLPYSCIGVAVEIDGGIWKGGRHTSGVGFSKDLEKINAAAEMGWLVLRYTPEMVESGDAIVQLQRVLKQ